MYLCVEAAGRRQLGAQPIMFLTAVVDMVLHMCILAKCFAFGLYFLL